MTRRTERQLLADATIALISAHIIDNTPDTIARVLTIFGLTQEELETAIDTARAKPGDPVLLAKRPVQKNRFNTRPRKVNAKGELFCTQGKHWGHTDDFAERTDRVTETKQWRSTCITHEREYKQHRYLNVNKKAELNRVGIEFEVLDGDDKLVCSDCGAPIDSGDKARGELEYVVHVSCPVN